ncbi:hypothetical protein FRIGORI9N_400116 [Frigoribacterium sp. 9N]|nr:hypothetical protein FRIGORI9N_400116 [Frigoribacterium sp. 9N]
MSDSQASLTSAGFTKATGSTMYSIAMDFGTSKLGIPVELSET